MGNYVIQVSLELTMQLRMTLNSWLPNTGITGMYATPGYLCFIMFLDLKKSA